MADRKENYKDYRYYVLLAPNQSHAYVFSSPRPLRSILTYHFRKQNCNTADYFTSWDTGQRPALYLLCSNRCSFYDACIRETAIRKHLQSLGYAISLTAKTKVSLLAMEDTNPEYIAVSALDYNHLLSPEQDLYQGYQPAAPRKLRHIDLPYSQQDYDDIVCEAAKRGLSPQEYCKQCINEPTLSADLYPLTQLSGALLTQQSQLSRYCEACLCNPARITQSATIDLCNAIDRHSDAIHQLRKSLQRITERSIPASRHKA